MSEVTFSSGKYTYKHHYQKGASKEIEIHDIFIRRSRVQVIFWGLCVLLCMTAGYLLLTMEKLSMISIVSIFWTLLLVILISFNTIKKESVVIVPEFGLQLETHLRSGRVIHRFIPMGNILRPVLNECVTPLTCYWSLSLILHGEEELMLVFKEYRPPMKMLIPIWKAMCAATNSK